ncbi:MAG: hypothetical protein R3B82_20600 [Sandaracinaceae bacterium]
MKTSKVGSALGACLQALGFTLRPYCFVLGSPANAAITIPDYPPAVAETFRLVANVLRLGDYHVPPAEVREDGLRFPLQWTDR